MVLSTIQLEWWQNPFGIFTVIAIGLSVLLVVSVVFFIVKLFIRHPKACLIIIGIIGIPIVLYNYLNDIIIFFQGEWGQRIIIIAVLSVAGLIAFKIVKAVRDKIIMEQIFNRSLEKMHSSDNIGNGLGNVHTFKMDISGKYIIKNGKVLRNRNYIKPKVTKQNI